MWGRKNSIITLQLILKILGQQRNLSTERRNNFQVSPYGPLALLPDRYCQIKYLSTLSNRFIHRIWIWPMSLRGIMFTMTVRQPLRRNCSLVSPYCQSFSSWYFSIVSVKISSWLPSQSISCVVHIAAQIQMMIELTRSDFDDNKDFNKAINQ